MFLRNDHYILLTKLYISITTSIITLLHCVLFISVMQSVNSAQVFSIAPLSLLSASLAASSAPDSATVVFPLANIIKSLQSCKFILVLNF